jgi:hypothetical protein
LLCAHFFLIVIITSVWGVANIFRHLFTVKYKKHKKSKTKDITHEARGFYNFVVVFVKSYKYSTGVIKPIGCLNKSPINNALS